MFYPAELTARARQYMENPHFHALVDSLREIMRDGRLTANDVRQAAFLAAEIYEHETVAPFAVGRKPGHPQWPEEK